ncbi:MAG: AMP-binding protein [Plectolyngbya sp. WJT66-NPBG17]|jgi:acyl-CoA synthetase (AMP-forming)/AMP-acid ligase II/acyl carrier protein|nr:AMP-binding protein [Plectolyngbya sp. WJT66-NPBG17]
MKTEGVRRKSNTRIGIVSVNSTGYVEAMFNCLEAGEIAVPLKHGDDRDRISAANIDRVLTPQNGNAWMTRTFQGSTSHSTAIVSFTSGTEGKSKGVLLTHQNLSDVVTRLNQVMQVDDTISEYIGVPVYHSFGFGRCRAISSASGKFFIPESGFNPAEIGAMLRKGEINAISAVPSLWRVLLSNTDLIGNAGRRVRWIEIGSQYMSRQEKEALKALFPEARIVQHYGLTEASRSTLLEIHQTEGDALESVGQAIGSVEINLTEEGQIAIRGNHVARAYLIDGEEIPIRDEQGWLITKDLGRLEDGRLYYQGRADDVINCGGIKVHPEALETKLFSKIGYSTGVAICRKPDPLRGDGFLVAVTPAVTIDKSELREAVSQATQAFGVNAGNSIAIVEIDQLPKTATGKVQRRQLAEWYTQQNLEQPAELTHSAIGKTIAADFCRVLNLRRVQPEDTFISLGGDSLSYVQLAMEFERHLGYLPQGWEQLSIADLEQLTPQHSRYSPIETNIILRAIAITVVVADHAYLMNLAGGAFLLLMIAGANLARFQSETLFRGRLIQPVFSLLRNLVTPYLIVAGLFQLWKRELDLSVLFLFSNFIDPDVASIFPVWFINLLVQVILGFSLLFAVKPIRKFAAASPWEFGLTTLLIGILAKVGISSVWDTAYLFDRVPHMLFWIFALGWMIQFSQAKPQKLITTIILWAIVPILASLNHTYVWWMLVGGTLLLWLPTISIPQMIKSPLQVLGAATYYIYLFHMLFIHVVRNVAGIQNPWPNTAAGLFGGLLVWAGVQAVQRLLAKRRSNTLETSSI